jgi:endoglycosylceramidase
MRWRGLFAWVLVVCLLFVFGCRDEADDNADDDDSPPTTDDDDDDDNDDNDDDDNTNDTSPADDDDNDDYTPGPEDEPRVGFLHTDGTWFLDEQNRVVILHGVQIIKQRPPFFSWHTAADYDRLNEWGFNSIRLGIMWEAVEPARGEYDEAFLAGLDERVGWARDRDVFVILDMHQDLYSYKYGGDGAPEWACIDHGIPYTPIEPWFFNYLQPAVVAAFNSFYANAQGVQDAFIDMWTLLAARYADDVGLLGYDLINEPYFGSHLPFVLFDQWWLQPFYERAVAAMQTVDLNHFYFLEPTGAVGAGFPCHLTAMEFPNIAYAPHFYSAVPMVFNLYFGNDGILREILRRETKDAAEMNAPLWIGEWALFSGQTTNRDAYMRDSTRLMDEYLASWNYWVYDKDDNVGLLQSDGTERDWVLDVLSRPYPQRVRGFPDALSFDPDTADFALTWTENADADGATVLFVPQARHYPDGFEVTMSDPDSWGQYWDSARQLLYIWADPSIPSHTIRIVRLTAL